jgi:hypothetical protein
MVILANGAGMVKPAKGPTLDERTESASPHTQATTVEIGLKTGA